VRGDCKLVVSFDNTHSIMKSKELRYELRVVLDSALRSGAASRAGRAGGDGGAGCAVSGAVTGQRPPPSPQAHAAPAVFEPKRAEQPRPGPAPAPAPRAAEPEPPPPLADSLAETRPGTAVHAAAGDDVEPLSAGTSSAGEWM
jgi:hypothetical protein